ncbi:helix-turn-helix domain-containing protein [Clostridium manihotivorum]|uniref:AraC family transcriptional regulator n=1 Tax=Clostridium manihotivorum TaxID=2320868 RepID=A0A410DYF5_9CLOT|nr:helix-turn-helix domain-containing protein [Clostridium manihotivorum]QAA34022.1 AraC family transcriptional regulator [Clostridium manihotivorum]
MDEFFRSDIYLFIDDIFFLIDCKAKPEILEKISEKHLNEKEISLSVEDKRNDLLIWNAVYIREIVKSGVSKKYLHTVYNKYYDKIHTLSTLLELQQLELDFIDTYLDIMINDVEIKDNFIVNKILQYLHINIESYVSLDTLSKALGISIGYASESFNKYMGTSIMKYAKEIKIDRAKHLLLNTDKSILEIGSLLGFYDQSHFSKTFKTLVGVSPTEFRNKNY